MTSVQCSILKVYKHPIYLLFVYMYRFKNSVNYLPMDHTNYIFRYVIIFNILLICSCQFTLFSVIFRLLALADFHQGRRR